MAPGWMATLNSAHWSAGKPSSSVARMRWPVEDTGRYSVTPSTMPSRMTRSRIGIGRSYRADLGSRRQVDPAAGEPPALVEPAEPFVGDRADRGRLDFERLEAWRAFRGDIVALQH